MAVATPMDMMAPIRLGTLKVVWVRKSAQTMPQSARQRADDDEGIEPALVVHHHQQVDQQRREGEAEAKAIEGLVHALHLPAHDDLGSGGRFLLSSFTIRLILAATEPRSLSCVLA